MKWLSFHSWNTSIDWKSPVWWMCASILESLKKVLSGQRTEPVDRKIITKKGKSVTVPCYDFTCMFLSLIHDCNLMKVSNFIEDFDIFMGESTIIGPTVCGNLHTGSAYVATKRRFCRGKNDFPLPIIFFYDKTHSNFCSSLATALAMTPIGIFNQDCRYLAKFWRRLGFVPNLNYRKGKFRKRSARDKLQDQSNCLKLIFKGISEVH